MYYPANKSRQPVPLPPTHRFGVALLLTGLVLLLVVFAVGTVLNSLLLRKLNGMGTPVLSAEYTAQHFLGELDSARLFLGLPGSRPAYHRSRFPVAG